MTEIKDKQEARVIALHRAIKELDYPQLLDINDLGAAYEALVSLVDLDKEEEALSGDQLKAMIRGFVVGLAATRLAQLAERQGPMYTLPPDEEMDPIEYSGGPTGGIVKGQGDDPAYVKQTGVRADGEPEGH